MIRYPSRRLTAALALAGLLSAIAPLGALAAFTDVKASTTYATAIESLRAKGVLAGYADGSFKPQQTINRAEFLKIVLEGRGTKTLSANDCFSDVKKSQWFSAYVCTAKQEGIVGGYPDGSFKPEQNISFVEAGKILALAYKQQVLEQGTQWYEPYAKALEASKAIPPSISSLTKPITRAEMAEMMWRIAEKKTDQPTKGLLNIKYPTVSINLAADTVQNAKSCADLQAFMSESVANQNAVPFRLSDDAVAPMAPEMSNAAGAPAARSMNTQKSADHSTTNVQVEGVDEGDIVKTDGAYLYVIHGQTIMIVQVATPASMKVVSTLNFTKDNFNPVDLYIDGDRLTVIGSSWKQGPMPLRSDAMQKNIAFSSMPTRWGGGLTEVRIYSVSDHRAPKIERTVSFDGNQISTRMIGSKLYLVMNQGLPYWGGPIPYSAKEADVLPTFNDSAKNVKGQPVTSCAKIAILPHVPSPQYLIVAMIPTDSTAKDVQKTVILGNGENVYASLDNLYVANTRWNYDWDSARSSSQEETTAFRFHFTDGGTEFQAQGSVPGHILNQFSMDENGQTFRIATTAGQSWDQSHASSSNLFVLNQDMQTVGKIEGIAPGEQIYSTRFLGNRVYMVTFKTVDPLFVLDTTDPRNPKILGKLKIPGYSNYLHPYDENHIIGFGKDVDEAVDADKVHSPNAVYYTAVQGLKMALFDVTDVANPREMFKEVIGGRGSDSPLLYNHKALLFEKDRNLLAFPVNVMTVRPGDESKKPLDQSLVNTFQGAYVYGLSLKDGFTLRGKIMHYTQDDMQKMGDSFYGKAIDRIVRSGTHLLTVGEDGVQSHDEKSVTLEGKVDFPQDPNTFIYPGVVPEPRPMR